MNPVAMALMLKKDGTSTHFVITAILVEPASLQTLEQQFNAIKQLYYPQSKPKSSKIGGKDYIRERLVKIKKKKLFPNY